MNEAQVDDIAARLSETMETLFHLVEELNQIQGPKHKERLFSVLSEGLSRFGVSLDGALKIGHLAEDPQQPRDTAEKVLNHWEPIAHQINLELEPFGLCILPCHRPAHWRPTSRGEA